MVFTNLGPHEKDAFFSLLDEYFSARPELFSQADGGSSSVNVASMKQAVSSNAESAAKFMSAGLKSAANASSRFASSAASHRSGSPAAAAESSENEPPVLAGRVAAAQAAFSSKKAPPAAERNSSLSSLTSAQKFGNVDTSSKSGFVSSLGSKKQSPPAVHIPSAFSAQKSSFAPPPSRVSTVSPRQPSPELEEVEEQGEWVEALYDYDSGEPGDLKIKEGERILLTEKTSDDWWTGEVNGRKGLFPSSYAKPL